MKSCWQRSKQLWPTIYVLTVQLTSRYSETCDERDRYQLTNSGSFPSAEQMLDCTQKICELTMNIVN